VIAVRSSASSSLGRAAARVGTLAALGVIPAALTAYLFAARGGAFAYDFHHAFWPAGRDVLQGSTPYVDPTSPDVARNVAFIYPALAALLLAPFALLGHAAADQLFTGLNVLAVLATLRILDVRDWRLYGLVLVCPSVVYGWHQANVTLPIVLGIAAVWRWRDHRVAAGLLVAVLVSVKLFVWPLGLWLVATRRYAALGYALCAGVALNVAAWLLLGLDEIPRYRQLLQAATDLEERSGYSPVAIALRAGADRSAAYLLALVLTAIAAVLIIALGRLARERCAMTVCVALCLVASPIVWLPYFALLIVPLAITRPQLSPAWLLLLPMWACPCVEPAGWQLAVVLTSATALVAVLVRPVSPRVLTAALRGSMRPPADVNPESRVSLRDT
jgi:hypothetical protein